MALAIVRSLFLVHKGRISRVVEKINGTMYSADCLAQSIVSNTSEHPENVTSAQKNNLIVQPGILRATTKSDPKLSSEPHFTIFKSLSVTNQWGQT